MRGLRLQGFSAGYRDRLNVLQEISLHAEEGQVTALLGPNGSGKSTLLKAVLGLVSREGEIILNGEDVAEMSAAERAKRIAYVPQRTHLTARLHVSEVVGLGRFAHRGPLARETAEDREAVLQALSEVGIQELASRIFTELSGGEQQRVLLARALATGATTLLLDEPTSALDVHQVLVLHRILKGLAARGCTILVVLHGLSEARSLADAAVLLKEGCIHGAGPVAEVVQEDRIRAVYGVDLIEGGGLGFELPGGSS